ncbi:hypothetical protein BKA56DRAFT_616628 [Ilyonectria sp. MPI-CAGE-AT-0026]|nr:hypothetical protein BKA56DRAFT_616628 [Ilyonectria sp. MPI-CAGE-AT-0026]
MGFSTVFWLLQLSLASAATLDDRSRTYSDFSVFRPVGIAAGIGYLSETSTVKTFQLNSASSFASIDYGTERAGTTTKHFPTYCFRVRMGHLRSTWARQSPFEPKHSTSRNPGATVRFSWKEDNGGSLSSFLTLVPLPLESWDWRLALPPSSRKSFRNLGARATATSCVDRGSQRAVWEVDSKLGVHVVNERPAQTTNTIGFESLNGPVPNATDGMIVHNTTLPVIGRRACAE